MISRRQLSTPAGSPIRFPKGNRTALTLADHRYRRSAGGCPIEATLDVIGGRWKGLLLYHLWESPKRFKDLRTLVPHVAQRILVKQLRELERDGLVTRLTGAPGTARVEYALTPLALELAPVLRALRDWGSQYLVASGLRE